MGLMTNFSSWMANTFNGVMDSLAGRMNTTLTSMYSPIDSPGSIRSNKTSEYLNVMDIDPNVYYDILEDYAYFNALVDQYANAVYEVISKDPCTISCNDKKIEDKMNKAIEEYKLKDYILTHLRNLIKRGTFTGMIEDTKEVSDIENPFLGKFVMKKGKFISSAIGEFKLPFYDLFAYWYDRSIVDTLTVAEAEELKRTKQSTSFDDLNQKIIKDLHIVKDDNKVKDEEDENVKKFKKAVMIDTVVFRGKGYFEPYLQDIYRIFIREYVWDALSLSEYLKSNMITTTIPAQNLDNRKMMDIANAVESLLNTDNINVIMSYSDPLQLLNQINDKLVNRHRVLPQIQDYSQIEQMDVTGMKEKLEMLREDIDNSKERLQKDLKIPEEIFTGGSGFRWEMTAKYEEYTNVLTHILQTVSDSIIRFCVSYLYRTTKVYYDPSIFNHKFDLNKFLTPYLNQSNVSALNERMKQVHELLETSAMMLDLPAIDDTKFLDYLQRELSNADPDLDGMLDYDKAAFKEVKEQVEAGGGGDDSLEALLNGGGEESSPGSSSGGGGSSEDDELMKLLNGEEEEGKTNEKPPDDFNVGFEGNNDFNLGKTGTSMEDSGLNMFDISNW